MKCFTLVDNIVRSLSMVFYNSAFVTLRSWSASDVKRSHVLVCVSSFGTNLAQDPIIALKDASLTIGEGGGSVEVCVEVVEGTIIQTSSFTLASLSASAQSEHLQIIHLITCIVDYLFIILPFTVKLGLILL